MNKTEDTFCFVCGRLLKNGVCSIKHKPKKTKRIKQPQFRGPSKWAKEQGMFEGLIE